MGGSQFSYLWTLSLLSTAITPTRKRQSRDKVPIQVTSERRECTARNLCVIIGILEGVVTDHLASTPTPASTVEELTELRTVTSHRKEASSSSAGRLS